MNKHCINCKWYESRSSFCRFDQPQVCIIKENNILVTRAMWPKISNPMLDWCSHFKQIETPIIDD